ASARFFATNVPRHAFCAKVTLWIFDQKYFYRPLSSPTLLHVSIKIGISKRHPSGALLQELLVFISRHRKTGRRLIDGEWRQVGTAIERGNRRPVQQANCHKSAN